MKNTNWLKICVIRGIIFLINWIYFRYHNQWLWILIQWLNDFVFPLFIISQWITHEICYSLKKYPTFWQFLLSFLFMNKTLSLNELKTRIAMNPKTSVFDFCVGKTICHYIIYMTVHLIRYIYDISVGLDGQGVWWQLHQATHVISKTQVWYVTSLKYCRMCFLIHSWINSFLHC